MLALLFGIIDVRGSDVALPLHSTLYTLHSIPYTLHPTPRLCRYVAAHLPFASIGTSLEPDRNLIGTSSEPHRNLTEG